MPRVFLSVMFKTLQHSKIRPTNRETTPRSWKETDQCFLPTQNPFAACGFPPRIRDHSPSSRSTPRRARQKMYDTPDASWTLGSAHANVLGDTLPHFSEDRKGMRFAWASATQGTFSLDHIFWHTPPRSARRALQVRSEHDETAVPVMMGILFAVYPLNTLM